VERVVRVFVSSTWLDLQPERQAVDKALQRMRDTRYQGMEYFGSREDAPRDVCLAEVDRASVYVGIFAHRYGSIDPDSGSSLTELEYRRARNRSIPCLIYLKDDSVPVLPAYIERDPAGMARLDALKAELKHNHTVSPPFRTPEELALAVVTDLHNLMVGEGWVPRDASLPAMLAELRGSGAIAQGTGTKAVGERGVLVEGDGHGNIVTGDGNIALSKGEEGKP